MTASWVDAVRAYAKQTGKWSVPKKGTAEYDAVKALQTKMKVAPPKVEPIKEEAPKKRLGRKPKAVEEAPVAEPVAPVKKTKKVAITEAPAEVAPAPAVEKKQRGLKKVAPVEAKPTEMVEAKPDPQYEAPKRVKKSLREPKVTIENKKVILSFD